MIQQVALVWFKPEATEAQIQALSNAMTALRTPGKREYRFSRDTGMRDGSAHAVVMATFDDEAAYRAYDTDSEHDRIRHELGRPVVARMERSHIRI